LVLAVEFFGAWPAAGNGSFFTRFRNAGSASFVIFSRIDDSRPIGVQPVDKSASAPSV
jgi:hypothetical protein